MEYGWILKIFNISGVRCRGSATGRVRVTGRLGLGLRVGLGAWCLSWGRVVLGVV